MTGPATLPFFGDKYKINQTNKLTNHACIMRHKWLFTVECVSDGKNLIYFLECSASHNSTIASFNHHSHCSKEHHMHLNYV